MAKNPIKSLYNYPPKVIEKVSSMKEYAEKIPTNKQKITTKLIVSIIFTIIIAIILKYINNCTTFKDAIISSTIIWTTVNIYDVFIIDILYFARSDKFVFKGTEDIRKEYKNYRFHIIEGLKGELIGLIICTISSLLVLVI